MEEFDFGVGDIGVFLMESITKGLYRDPKNVLREYISNELDNSPEPTEINVKLDGNRIDIAGDGPGMDKAGIRTAVKIGFSPKDPENNIGFRGIGIYSGVSICDRIAIVTKKAGETEYYTIHINCRGLREDTEKRRNTMLIESLKTNVKWDQRGAGDSNRGKHGTTVSLHDVLPVFEGMFDKAVVRRYLENTIPVHLDPAFPRRAEIERYLKQKLGAEYRILEKLRLDGNPVWRAPRLFDLEPPTFGELKHRNRILAYYWVCQNSRREKIEEEEVRGLQIRKKGFAVGTRASVLKQFSRNANLVEWFTGEIHVVGADLIPNAERAELEATPAREELERKIKKDLGGQLSDMARTKSATERAQERIDEANKLANHPTFDDHEEWMQAWRGAEDLREQLHHDATEPYVRKPTQEKVSRAVNRVEAYIKKLRSLKVDVVDESRSNTGDEADGETDSKPAVEVEEAHPETPTNTEPEDEPDFLTRALAEVSGMCNRAGKGELTELATALFSALIEDGTLRDYESFKRVLGKVELRLATG
jgi:Histidine kinase-, DNA gyrase B-, and HSP90-like ATPase